MTSPESQNLKYFVMDGSDASIQDTIAKLKFISKIKPGEVIDLPSLQMMEVCSSTSLYRTLIKSSGSKDASLVFFRRVIGDSIDTLGNLSLKPSDTFYKNISKMILDSLKECKTGLKNHCETYKTDIMHIAKVETLIGILDAKISEFNEEPKTL